MCGFDTRDRKKEAQIIPLLACSKPISNHIASLGFSGSEDEVELILSRAAVFKFYNHFSITSRKAWFGLEAGIYYAV